MTFFRPLLHKQIACTVLAMAFAQTIVFLTPIKQGFWVPLTTLTVCLTIGSSIAAFRRGFHRVLGTILGVLIGGLISTYVPHIDILLILIIVFAAIAYWSKCFQALYYLFVSFITIAIILLLSIYWHDNRIVFTSLMSIRVIDTIIGSAIAYGFALLILPHHHHNDLLKTMQQSMLKIYLTYEGCLKLLINAKKTNSFDFNEPIQEINSFISNSVPIWSYELLFNRYIYSHFVLFIHRVHKIVIILKMLNITLDKIETKESPELMTLLKQNKTAFLAAIKNIIKLRKNGAILAINKLSLINTQLMEHFGSTPDQHLSQAIILLKEIEDDLYAIIYSVTLLYLYDKRRKTH